MKKFVYILISVLLVYSCKPKLDEPSYEAKNLDLTRFYCFGDGALSGFMNGGLYVEGQNQSLGNILANQFQQVGGGSFNQPLMPSGNGSGYFSLKSYTDISDFSLEYHSPNAITSSYTPTVFECDIKNDSINLYQRYNGNNNNFAIPGLRLTQLQRIDHGNNSNPSYINPYFERILTEGSSSTYLEVVGNTNPSFCAIWFGIDELVRYIKSDKSCSWTQVNQVNTSLIESRYRSLVDTLVKKGAKGVLIGVPQPKHLSMLNREFRPSQTIYAERINPLSGYSYSVSEVLVGSDFLTVNAISKLGTDDGSGNLYGYSSNNPINSSEILDFYEVDVANKIYQSINSISEALANEYGLAFVNMSNFLQYDDGSSTKPLPDYLIFNGINYTSNNYVEGGVFSLDGYSLTGRGNAILANKIISSINDKYQTKIPLCDVNSYEGIRY